MALDIGRRRLGREIGTARDAGRPTPGVVIVGAGLSGLAFAIQLVRSGTRDFTIVEQSDGVGGTWRDNTYPGSGCDVPSHLYSLSFFPKSDWTRRFADQPEILSYAERCVDRFELGPHLRLGTTVQRAEFDEDQRRWRLVLASAGGEEQIVADTVIFACGQLNRPHVPDLPGLGDFAGPMWHSARWDHGCDLAGQRVAVVGSGASAIQFVPPVAERAAALTIYQRTPNYVGPKKDRPYGAADPMAVRQRAPSSSGPTGGGSTGASSPGGSGSARTVGPAASWRLCSPRGSATRWCPSACPRSRWSPTTRSAASASSSPTTGTRR